MTLKEAGEMYVAQKDKIDKVTEDLGIVRKLLKAADTGPVGSFTTCIVRTDILKRVASHLEDHLKHLNYIMEKEMP